MTALTAREAYQIWKRDFRRGRLLGDYTDFNARFRDMAYATGLMPLPPGWKLPRWAMSVGMVLGGRGAAGYVLGRGAGSAAANWWEAGGATNCVAAYQPKGAASLAASYINLANPGTYDAAPGVAPTWNAATGWTFNGSSQYLTTGIVPASTWTMIAKFTCTDTNIAIVCGCRSTTNNRFYLAPRGTANDHLYGFGSATATLANALSSGVMALAGNQPYLNGSTDGGAISATAFTSDRAISIGGEQQASVLNLFSGTVSSVWIADTTLNAAAVAAQAAAMP